MLKARRHTIKTKVACLVQKLLHFFAQDGYFGVVTWISVSPTFALKILSSLGDKQCLRHCLLRRLKGRFNGVHSSFILGPPHRRARLRALDGVQCYGRQPCHGIELLFAGKELFDLNVEVFIAHCSTLVFSHWQTEISCQQLRQISVSFPGDV